MTKVTDLASSASWPQEASDIAEVVKFLRPEVSPAQAERLIRNLLDIAKVAAFGAGAKYAMDEMRELCGMIGEMK